MATKNIALDFEVYQRLAKYKRESESFSKAVKRMLEMIDRHHTGRDILLTLDRIPDLSAEDARTMREVVEENRRESWDSDDLR